MAPCINDANEKGSVERRRGIKEKTTSYFGPEPNKLVRTTEMASKCNQYCSFCHQLFSRPWSIRMHWKDLRWSLKSLWEKLKTKQSQIWWDFLVCPLYIISNRSNTQHFFIQVSVDEYEMFITEFDQPIMVEKTNYIWTFFCLMEWSIRWSIKNIVNVYYNIIIKN